VGCVLLHIVKNEIGACVVGIYSTVSYEIFIPCNQVSLKATGLQFQVRTSYLRIKAFRNIRFLGFENGIYNGKKKKP
jgi:hypothetical protein